jgi:tol-pal system-associated acyl-CoA thioesterase
VRVKVYYADTDAGGVVYYANYLRWLEMARFELLDNHGMSVVDYASQGFIFAVVHLEMDYHAPAVLGDELEVDAEVERVRRVRFTLRQRVVRCSDDQQLVTASITLACVDPQGKLIALPDELADTLRGRLG